MGGDGEQHAQHEASGHGPEHVLQGDPQPLPEVAAPEDLGHLAEPDVALCRSGAILLVHAEVEEPVEGVEEEDAEDHQRRRQHGVGRERLADATALVHSSAPETGSNTARWAGGTDRVTEVPTGMSASPVP